VYKIELEVSGQPQGKGRPRFTKTGHAYTPEKTREYEKRIFAAAWKAAKDNKIDITESFVSVEITAFMDIPQSWSKLKRLEAEYGAIQHTIKPDLDNIIKAALDGCEGAIYVSDKQVTSIRAKKRYCNPDKGAFLYISVSWEE